MRAGNGEISNLVHRPIRHPGHFARRTPQHGVDQAAGAPPRRLARERNGSVDRSVRRHAGQMAHLKKPEPERIQHREFELFDWLRA